MRYDFVYENNNGEKINLSKLPYKINIEPLIDYSWSYKTKQRQLGNKIVGFFKDIKDSTATLHVLAATAKERDEAIDYFNNVIEKDIYYGTAGKLWLGDWYTYAFITASKNSKWQYDAGIVKKEITISKEADSWYHITRSANYGEQEESTVYITEDFIKTYESSGVDSGIKSLVANIVPKQSGSGTPSPENIRPISGWTEVTVFVSPTEDEEDATTHTTDLGRTVYGGTVDLVSGQLVDNMAIVDGGTLNWSYDPNWHGFVATIADFNNPNVYNVLPNLICEKYETKVYNGTSPCITSWGGLGAHLVLIRDDSFTDATAFKTAMNGVQLCYELAEPQTYTLTPQTINTLAGVNNVWADSGDVTVTFRDDHGGIQTESGSIVTFEKKNALSGSGYDYAYDYMHDAQSQKIIANAGSIPCDFIITIQGYADSPIITIGDNTYAVNVEVPYGANLVIDSTQKTVIITLADGTKINAFGARDPDYYLFERIESGKNAVTWDGSYLWELLMIEERSEPRWLTD